VAGLCSMLLSVFREVDEKTAVTGSQVGICAFTQLLFSVIYNVSQKSPAQTPVRIFAKYSVFKMPSLAHTHTRQEICNEAIITDPTTP